MKRNTQPREFRYINRIWFIPYFNLSLLENQSFVEDLKVKLYILSQL